MARRNVDIRETQWDDLSPCANTAIYSKRGAGKTTFMSYMVDRLYYCCGVRKFIAFAGNRDARAGLSKVIHPLYVHPPNLDALRTVMAYQADKVGEAREAFEEGERMRAARDPHYHAREFVVPDRLKLGIFFDDIGGNPKFARSVEMKALASDGRHYGACIFTAYQKATQSLTEVRDNVDYICILKIQSDVELKRLYEEYVGDTIVDRKTFRFILNAATAKRGTCLWIKNDGSDVDLQTKLFFGRVPYPVPHKLMGGRQYVDYGRHHYISTRKMNQVMRGASPPPVRPERGSVVSWAPSTSQVEEGSALWGSPPPQEDDGATVSSVPAFHGPLGSTVSLNRRRHIPLQTMREGRHTFTDRKGNVVNVNMLKHKLL